METFFDKYQSSSPTSFNEPISSSSTPVNFLTNPISVYQDLISSVAKENDVENNIDNLYKLEYIGIRNNSQAGGTSVDEKFKESIELKNGH